MEQLQNSSKSLQKDGLKQWHIVAVMVAVLLLVCLNIWPQYTYAVIGALALAGGVAWYTWGIAERVREQREEAARAWSYANMCGPVLIMSSHPNETVEEVHERAAKFRRQLELSGNHYHRQIPFVVYPYNPMLFGQGQLTMSWNVYQRMAGEQLHKENLIWADTCPAELKPIFLSQVMPQPAAAQTETV